jgi:hypothetical protein
MIRPSTIQLQGTAGQTQEVFMQAERLSAYQAERLSAFKAAPAAIIARVGQPGVFGLSLEQFWKILDRLCGARAITEVTACGVDPG